MDALTHEPDRAAEQSLPITENEEQRNREMEWENEGGRVRKVERRKRAAAVAGSIANDN